MEVNAVSSDGEWTPLLLAVNLFSGEVAIPICETLLDGKADVNSTVSAGIYRRLMPVTIARRGGQDAARHGYFGPGTPHTVKIARFSISKRAVFSMNK